MVLHCGFNLHFLMTNDVEHLLIFLLTTYISSLVKYMFKSCSFFIYFLTVEFWECFMYSEHKLLVRYMICEYFLPFCSLFHSLNSVCQRAKVLILTKPYLSIFSFYRWHFGYHKRCILIAGCTIHNDDKKVIYVPICKALMFLELYLYKIEEGTDKSIWAIEN